MRVCVGSLDSFYKENDMDEPLTMSQFATSADYWKARAERAESRNEMTMKNEGRTYLPPCNGCKTPGKCATDENCATASLDVPTYYVAHPDGTYSVANPQPRFVGSHRPTTGD